MIVSRRCHRWVTGLALSGIAMVAASCALVEKGIDRSTGGPNAPAETAIHLQSALPEPTRARSLPTAPPEALKVSLAEAVLLSLENNRALVVERLAPAIQQTLEDRERAAFDATVSAEVSTGRERGERLARTGPETEDFTNDAARGVIALEQYFPTGTAVALQAGMQMTDASLYEDRFYSTRLGMTVSQALLRGYGADVNLARLKQARLDTRMSEFELRAFSEFLVAEVERTYWDYALAHRQIEIVEESLKVARQQLNETEELVAVGRLARAELPAVRAEVAAQEQELIEARAGRESIRLQFLRLLNPAGPGIWHRAVELVHAPALPEIQLEDVAVHVAVSSRMRAILNQARLEILRGDLEIVKTRNGLLPLLDLFITLGKTGYADSMGRSIENINQDSYDALAGFRFNYPLSNRDAHALHRRARLTLEQAQHALENLAQLVEVDVRIAYIEVDRTQQQIAASSVTRRFDEEKLSIETEKLRVGKSTSFLVAQAQRDLLVSRIAEVRALANYLKALIELFRHDGSLLERRGISAPGRDPVMLAP